MYLHQSMILIDVTTFYHTLCVGVLANIITTFKEMQYHTANSITQQFFSKLSYLYVAETKPCM